jgi:hypothetical protein
MFRFYSLSQGSASSRSDGPEPLVSKSVPTLLSMGFSVIFYHSSHLQWFSGLHEWKLEHQ